MASHSMCLRCRSGSHPIGGQSANRRGLTNAERELFEMLRGRLQKVTEAIDLVLAENAVAHAPPVFALLDGMHQGAAVLQALTEGH